MDQKIEKIEAKEVLNSGNNPTIEVNVYVGGIAGTFAVPSGKSKGSHEAVEKSVEEAIQSVSEINSALNGLLINDQKLIDRKLIELDGTPDKSRLGGNALIGVSVACAKAGAQVKGEEIFEYLREIAGIESFNKIPRLYINLVDGGKHSKSPLAFQEYHIVPETDNIREALEQATKIQSSLQVLVEKEFGNIVLGDEGGFVLNTSSVEKPLELLTQAIKNTGLDGRIKLSLDVAASSFFKNGKYVIGEKEYEKEELISLYENLVSKYGIFSIEDPFEEEDFEGFKQIREEIKVSTVGDDLTVTNPERIKRAIDFGSINAVIIKPNQIGTLTETFEAMRVAQENGVDCIVSHRSGETQDTFIADLAWAFGCLGLKAGAPNQEVRKVKYERLMNIQNSMPRRPEGSGSRPSALRSERAEASGANSRAQIVVTLGPVSKDESVIREMAQKGMDVVRLNLSWGTHEEHANYIKSVRKVASELKKTIPIIFDLSGPRIQDEAGHHIDNTQEKVITSKDLEDLKLGLEQKVEYIALSYVGKAEDVSELKQNIEGLRGRAKVIAKIERNEALADLDNILNVSDAIMIARGDLGNEVSLEEIPWYEKEIIKKCKLAGKPVIVATQMMISMMKNDEPTRAEVTDVFFAIENGADAVMLSDETAKGEHSVETVAMMEKVIRETETHYEGKVNLL